MDYSDRLRASDYLVIVPSLDQARAFIEQEHYAKGVSAVATYRHGLVAASDPSVLLGVVWWLPPTRVAAERAVRQHWQGGDWRRVLALSRLVIKQGVPKNAAGFLMAQSIRRVRKDGRFLLLLTYADSEQGHTGTVYRATNWQYDGETGAKSVWIDQHGRRVSKKNGRRSRTSAEMHALGHRYAGRHKKKRFYLLFATGHAPRSEV